MTLVPVTVVGPSGRDDLSLPADAPLYELLPSLVRLVGGDENGVLEPDAWRISLSAGETLPSGSTLAASGVLEGSVLYLERARASDEGEATSAPPQPDDERTPGERTAAILPPRYGPGRRLREATRAFFGARGEGGEADASPSAAVARDPGGPPAPVPAAALTRERPAPPLERARRVWRSTRYLEQLEAAIVAPRLRRSVTIAVLSPKGGVGKTTTTALLGTLLSMLRADRFVAVDTNPDYGSLGRILAPEQHVFVDDLLGRLDQPGLTLTELDAQLGRAAHGLMVLPAPTDPARMARLDEDAYTTVIRRLQEFAGVVLLDCGTGLQEPTARAAIKTSDQLLLVTDAEPASASLVAEAGMMLVRTGRPITLVVNKMPTGGSRLDLDRFERFLPQASGLVVIQSEPNAAERLVTGEFEWRDAPASWQRAVRELAAAIVSEWPGLGLTLAPAPTAQARE